MEKHVSPEDFAAIATDVKRYIGFLSDLGCHGFDCSKESLDILSGWGKPRSMKTSPSSGNQTNKVQDSMESLRADWGDCKRCSRSGQRHALVFGSGDPHARLMFIGDAPSHDDDKTGEPFAGEPGQLLTKMIGGMGLTRDAVYVSYILKCRTTENRHPFPEEINACFPVLERQIQMVKPEVICTLGAFATQAILGKHNEVARLRGNFQAYGSCQVMPTFHPAYLLKNPASKRDAWEDLKKIMALLGLKRQA